MKKKLAAAVLSAVMMMSLFAGCGSQETTGSGGAEGETTTIQFWHTWQEIGRASCRERVYVLV